MDRLIVEKETEEKVEEKLQPEIEVAVEEKTEPTTEYLTSFEDLTVADIKKQQEDERVEQFKAEKDELIKKQYEIVDNKQEIKQKPSENIIEKPNYDLIEENKKVLSLKKNKKEKPKNRKKVAGIALACALGASAIVCITNAVIIENMNASYSNLYNEYYNINLPSYLKKISDLDATKNSMEMIETYPDKMLDAGDLGEKSNWFDRLCNFIGGIFGG